VALSTGCLFAQTPKPDIAPGADSGRRLLFGRQCGLSLHAVTFGLTQTSHMRIGL
jgi:hypothetical protein